MRKLELDFDAVGSFMEDYTRESNDYYLDLQTGATLLIPVEVMAAVEDGEIEKLSDWQEDFVESAKAVHGDNDGRYNRIPEVYSSEVYEFMVEFANTVTDKSLIEKLEIALDGAGAFRRFKNVLATYAGELDRWYIFKSDKLNEEICGWLERLEIEAIEKKRQL